MQIKREENEGPKRNKTEVKTLKKQRTQTNKAECIRNKRGGKDRKEANV
jgi:hypothetical protein